MPSIRILAAVAAAIIGLFPSAIPAAEHLVRFAIDPDKGTLSPTGMRADVPASTCIRFRPMG